MKRFIYQLYLVILNMKTRITVTIDDETHQKVRERLRKAVYLRNKSHLVEVAIKEFLNRRPI